MLAAAWNVDVDDFAEGVIVGRCARLRRERSRSSTSERTSQHSHMIHKLPTEKLEKLNNVEVGRES